MRHLEARATGRPSDVGAVQLEHSLLATLVALVVAVALGPFGAAVSALLVDATNAF